MFALRMARFISSCTGQVIDRIHASDCHSQRRRFSFPAEEGDQRVRTEDGP